MFVLRRKAAAQQIVRSTATVLLVLVLAWPVSAEPASEPASSEAVEAIPPIEEDASEQLLGGSARFGGELYSRSSLDLGFEDSGEDIFEFRNRALLTLDYRVPSRMRVQLGARLDWFLVGAKPLRGSYYLFNLNRPRWQAFVDLREAFVDFYTRHVDLRVGNQLFAWGQNEGVSPVDVLNPIDARDPLAATELLKLPIPAVTATIALGRSGTLRLVMAPFFIPSKVMILGQDFSLLTPGGRLQRAVGDTTRFVDPSIEPRLQEALSGTRLPDASPLNGTYAARLSYQLGPVDVAVSGIYGWNRLPTIKIDSDLALLASGNASDLQGVLANPKSRAALLRLAQKVELGVRLADVYYQRRGVIGLDVATTLGDFTVKGDVGVAPGTVLYNDDFAPLRKTVLSGALGAEYAYGEYLQAALSWYASGVLGLLATERLMFLEQRYVIANQPRNALAWGFLAIVRSRLFDERLELRAVAAYNVSTGDHALAGQAAYHFTEQHHLSVGVLFLQGPAGSPLNYFDRNDLVFVDYRYSF